MPTAGRFLASTAKYWQRACCCNPHLGEKSFTRTQAGILIPQTIERVRVRAHDLVHGYGGREVEVILT